MWSYNLLFLCAAGLARSSPTPTITTGPLYTDQCVLGRDSCPPGSACTQTVTCNGVCLPTLVPKSPCNMGPSSSCPSGSTCTPTLSPCPSTGPCGGLCLATPPPEIPCTMGGCNECPTGSTCTPTMWCPSTAPCGGACISTGPPPPGTCILGGGNCPSGEACTQTEVCSGLCYPTGTPTPESDPCVAVRHGHKWMDDCLCGSSCAPTTTLHPGAHTFFGTCDSTPTPH